MFFSCTHHWGASRVFLMLPKEWVTPAQFGDWDGYRKVRAPAAVLPSSTCASHMGGIAIDWEGDKGFRSDQHSLIVRMNSFQVLIRAAQHTAVLCFSSLILPRVTPAPNWNSWWSCMIQQEKYGLDIRIGKSNRPTCDVLQKIILYSAHMLYSLNRLHLSSHSAFFCLGKRKKHRALQYVSLVEGVWNKMEFKVPSHSDHPGFCDFRMLKSPMFLLLTISAASCHSEDLSPCSINLR